jgi:hypothetical protein
MDAIESPRNQIVLKSSQQKANNAYSSREKKNSATKKNNTNDSSGCFSVLLILGIVFFIGFFVGKKKEEKKLEAYEETSISSSSTTDNSTSDIYVSTSYGELDPNYVQTTDCEQDVYYIYMDNIVSNDSDYGPDDTVATFCNPIYGKIILTAGDPYSFGLRHILDRHTARYYTDDTKASEFPEDVTADDIVSMIKKFYPSAVLTMSRNTDNIVYVGIISYEHKPLRCLLVVNRYTDYVVTFYPVELKSAGLCYDGSYYSD